MLSACKSLDWTTRPAMNAACQRARSSATRHERRDEVSAYIVLTQEIDDVDPDRNGYVPAAQPLLHRHGAAVGRLEETGPLEPGPQVGALDHEAAVGANRGQLGCEPFDGDAKTGRSA